MNAQEPLWKPSAARVENANMTRFQREIEARHGLQFADYPQLHDWSVRYPELFWNAVWDFCGILGDRSSEPVLQNAERFAGARWFAGTRLNFAENLLRRRDEHPALVSYLETGKRESVSHAELAARVAAFAHCLRAWGVTPGDRVAGLLPNISATVVAMLATASIGAIWTSCSPDFGLSSIQDRFGQTQPKVLLACDGYYYGGKSFDIRAKVEQLRDTLPDLRQLVLVNVLDANSALPGAVTFRQALDAGAGQPLRCARLPFAQPLYILYSSGTTGKPKCIVHGAGGTLLQHVKEHRLHVDLNDTDVLYYFTTCGWMMWNWLVSGLASGATLLLYDGSPFHPGPQALWDIAEREGVTVFGTSAKYLAALNNAGFSPRRQYPLARLKSVLSTGSPLTETGFRYVYEHIKRDLCLSSISGGTDVICCFAIGNPTLPVFEGQLQCIALGMAAEVWDEQGHSLREQKGELVCTRPFPSTPVYFWNDPDGARYHKAYFARFPNVWAHGDYAEITAQNGVIIHGRSDATLNPGGVRIGTAEIYRQVEKIAAVADSICVGQRWQGDTRVLLFVQLREGARLDAALIQEIKQTIRSNTTPRHVPELILQVDDIPRTLTGKPVEIAVTQTLHGEHVGNLEALANPGALEPFKRFFPQADH